MTVLCRNELILRVYRRVRPSNLSSGFIFLRWVSAQKDETGTCGGFCSGNRHRRRATGSPAYWDLTGFCTSWNPPFQLFSHFLPPTKPPFLHFLLKCAEPWAHSGAFSPTVKRVIFRHSGVWKRKTTSETGGHPEEASRRVEGPF